MILEKEREEIIKWSRELIKRGLTKGTSGNLSICDREKNLVAITPSGMDYMILEPGDIVITDLKGNVVEGRWKPSSELMMHNAFYINRQDLSAIVHAHTTYATAIACLRIDLPAVHYMIALAGENVRCAEYATFGTKKLADNACEAMKGRNAVLLANHGILTGSYSLENAFNILEEVEYVAKLYFISKSAGSPVILDSDEMKIMEQKFKTYGQR
jgi:L-fuculose-phosphate aldolase